MLLKNVFLLGVLLSLCGEIREIHASRLLTYNTFLANSEQEFEKRATYITNNIDSTNADIICLQEVWDESEVKAIVSANKENYPFTFSGLHSNTQELLSTPSRPRPRCLEPVAFKVLFKALANGCLTIEGSTISKLQCLYEKAGIFDLSRPCLSCLSFSGFDYRSLLKNCFLKKNRSNLPGLLVLSKRKLVGPSLTYFDPEKTILNRAYISFEDESVGDIRCTHQSYASISSLGDAYLETNLVEKYGSWEKQNLDETMKLINSFSSNGRRAIIMGDLNSGPFIPIQGDDGYFMDSYKYFLDNGFLPSLDSECTYCLENPLAEDNVSSLIDHILVRPPADENKKYSAERVFRNPIPGEIFPPSDHYGVQLKIEQQ